MTTPNKPLVALAAICIAISWILVILFLLAFIAVTICVAAGLLPTRINIGHSGQNFLAAFFATFFICGAIWISLAFSLSCPHCGFKFLKNPKGLGPTKFQYHPNSAGKHGMNGWAVQVVSFLTTGRIRCIKCGEEIFGEPSRDTS